jgi:hypothetical protein
MMTMICSSGGIVEEEEYLMVYLQQYFERGRRDNNIVAKDNIKSISRYEFALCFLFLFWINSSMVAVV